MIILSPNTLLKGGEYRILSMLGQGGFGITYLALHTQLDVKVAIKEFFMKDFCERGSDSHVSLGSSGSREMVERFRAKFIKEAQNIARLRHANIVRVTDVFEDNGTAYYVMEYHDGGSLADLVKSNGHLSEKKAVGYARQIADALDYLHARKINHLDVKPANVLLNEDGEAVLIDFGLAKHYDSEGNQTSTTPVGISHGYAPMEQYRRGGVGTFSPTSDIYSLGATLYKMLTGVTPPEASDLLNEGLPPMTVVVSPAVRNAVEQAMSPLIKDRPQSIKAFLLLLNTPAPAVDEDKTELVPDIEPTTDETEIVSDTTPIVKEVYYAVGDIITINGVEGIVYKVDDTCQHGMAVSLERKHCDWYGAKEWCSDLGEGWRLPSQTELLDIYGKKDQLNNVLKQKGKKKIDLVFYWSSTEYDSDCAWVVSMLSGYTLGNYESATYSVRAVSAF